MKGQYIVVQLLSCVRLLATPLTATSQASLSFTIPQFVPTHVRWVSDAIQSSHPLLAPSSLALNLSQHQDCFQWISFSHEVPRELELQLQHESFQWMMKGQCVVRIRYFYVYLYHLSGFPSGSDGKKKKLPAMWKTWVWSLGGEDPLEKGMANPSSIPAWRILWIEGHEVTKSRTRLSD